MLSFVDHVIYLFCFICPATFMARIVKDLGRWYASVLSSIIIVFVLLTRSLDEDAQVIIVNNNKS